MSTTTTNYKLHKPELTDPADITQMNQNWDIIDDELKKLRVAVAITSGTLNDYTDVGMYVYSAGNSQNITNVPEKAQSTMLVLPRLLPDDVNNRVQVVITQTNNLYIRNYTGGTWEKWSQYRKDIISVEYGGTGATTITDARKKFSLPEQCVTITDWNEATKTGWYMANNGGNAPTDGWYFGFVLVHASDYLFQEVYQFTASKEAIAIPKYIRAKTNDQWGEWYNVTVQRNVPKDAKLDYIKTLTSDAQAQINSKMPNGTVPISKGGTNATDVETARANLGFVSGSYDGTGSPQTITIPGAKNRNVIFIWASGIDGSLGAKGYITPQGGVMTCGTINDQAFNTETVGIRSYSRGTQNNCYFENGTLYINSMSSSIAMNYINKSETKYYYQVM